MRRLVLAYLISCFVMVSSVAAAQPTDDERTRAGEAYDRGARAYRNHDYVESARWFERANQLAPSPIATVQAVRAHLQARNFLRAGTLALALEGDPGLSPRVAETVREAVTAATERYARIEVTCSAQCELAVDGEPTNAPRFYIEPDREITIVATFSNGTKTETTSGPVGSTRAVAFEAPAGATPNEAAASLDEDFELDEGENPYRISSAAIFSRPRALFFVALTATAVIGGITTWSVIDAKHSREDLQAAVASSDPNEDVIRAEHRQDRFRSRGYYIFTGVVGAMTGLAGALTDWSPEGNEPSTEATVEASPTGAAVTVTHRF